jgi:nucleotide-binding universal stress UspA family protein
MEGIVVGTHDRRGFDRLVLGSATDRVIRKAACPVLVVSSASHTAWDTGPDGRHRLSRIIYCTDFSNNSARAREYAISLAAEYSAALISFHVAENVSDVARAEAIIAEGIKELGKLVSETECKNLKVSLTVKFGKPYEEIVRYATDVQAS